MREIASPDPRFLPALHTQINDHLEVLFCQDLARARLIDIGLGLAIGQ